MVADPGGAKTNLNKDEPSQKFFLTRWCANGYGYLTGNRRSIVNAIYPILYAIGGDDVKNGTFIRWEEQIQILYRNNLTQISARRRPIEWGKNAENSELRKILWAMSEKWTKLAEHMDQMEKELEIPKYYSTGRERVEEKVKEHRRSARYLWLA